MLKIACGYRFATSVCGIECCSESVEISNALLCETVLMMVVAMCPLFFSRIMFTDLKNRHTKKFLCPGHATETGKRHRADIDSRQSTDRQESQGKSIELKF